MGRPGAVYEIVNAKGEVLSRHKTRQAAIDGWRLGFPGQPIQVWRRTVPRGETLIVEGTWWESTRPEGRPRGSWAEAGDQAEATALIDAGGDALEDGEVEGPNSA